MKIKQSMRYFSVLIFLVFFRIPASAQEKGPDYGILYSHSDSLQYEVYPLNKGWGYKLYHHFQLKVNQSNIPAIEGNMPFETKEAARKVAQMAISKMAAGIMPPTLSAEEVNACLNDKYSYENN